MEKDSRDTEEIRMIQLRIGPLGTSEMSTYLFKLFLINFSLQKSDFEGKFHIQK